ncbi:hypothetical protein E1301_Tti022869 [Triplophysa tibetana]|uniref:PiggyBac transposable element-derived protein domain-containing protein n=1 Tax=Triplophysa tibetana TaxID=1572043 RepID=A0A5A9PK00_9TELE|nr:hypothetical protein E1301_Tti022869 [Triplophysa tibetana]
MCSTLHSAHAGDTVQGRVRDADGHLVLKDIRVPPTVKEYNRYVFYDQQYIMLFEMNKICVSMFLHLSLQIAIVNAFLIYKHITKGKGEVPMHQKAFRETLIEELAVAADIPAPSSTPHRAHHKPVHISGDNTTGRLSCRHCHAKTPVKCSSCDVPLCFLPSRDCYNEWHVANNL